MFIQTVFRYLLWSANIMFDISAVNYEEHRITYEIEFVWNISSFDSSCLCVRSGRIFTDKYAFRF